MLILKPIHQASPTSSYDVSHQSMQCERGNIIEVGVLREDLKRRKQEVKEIEAILKKKE